MSSRLHDRAHGALAVLLAAAAALPCAAEVGAVHVARNDASTYVFTIIDDPDILPGRSSWTPYAPADASRVLLNPDGAILGDGSPHVVYNPIDRSSVAVWSRAVAGGFDVVASRFADGAWSEPTVVAGTSDDELDPFAVVDPTDGSLRILYWTGPTPGGCSRVLLVETTAGLSAPSAPIEVSLPAECAMRPAGEFYQGQLRVIYEARPELADDPPRDIVLATRYAAGFVSQVLAVAQNADPSWPQVHTTTGKIWVEWFDAPQSMAWTEQESGQPWSPVTSETYTTPEDRDYFARGRIRGRALD